MPDLNDYIRVLIFEKFPRNISLSSEFRERSSITAFFERQIEKTLMPFGVQEKIPVSQFAELLFSELEAEGLIDTITDPLAGKYYWVNIQKVGKYMSDQISVSDIFQRKKMLKDDKLYEAVFSKVLDENFEFENPESLNNLMQAAPALTVKAHLSESERAEFRGYLAPIRDEIEAADLAQEERADALAALKAIDELSEAPNPLWNVIAAILSSPILANVTSLAALAISVLKP